MVSIVTKKIHGKEYLYLVTSVRKGKRVIQKTVRYLGKKRTITREEFACIEYSYKKQDWVLTSCNDTLSYQDHQEMKRKSDNYKAHVKSLDTTSQEKERERFLSTFIAHSNAIEGSTLTPKDTFNFLFNDITPQGKSKKELFMAQNLLKAWEYVEKYKEKMITKKDLCVLHSMVNSNVESEETLGRYKSVQNYVGNEYTTSFIFVEERMRQLFRWIRSAWKKKDDFEVAFQSHAQFEIIHPFVDGNGRVGRLLLNWLLMYKKLMPLAIEAKKRSEYITALSNSRKGKIEAISKFCFEQYVRQYDFVVVK